MFAIVLIIVLFSTDQNQSNMLLKDVKSQLSVDKVMKLSSQFENMVRGEHGVSYVQTDDDVYYPKLVELFISKVVGSASTSHFKVTGSASQMLKCVSESNQGDADILLLSSFPKMTKEFQQDALLPCEEPGFYRIKQLNMKVFPFVKREGAKYLNANSLRSFESIWFHKTLQLPLSVVESFDHEFERAARDKVASVLSWKSSTDFELDPLKADLINKDIQYFYVLSNSYKKHIIPILDERSKRHAEKVIDVFMNIAKTSSNFGTLRAKTGYETLLQLGPEFENGLIPAALGYYRENERLPKIFTDAKEENIFIEISKYFQMVVSDDVISGDDHLFSMNQEMKGSFDLVPAISCEGFPSIANNWGLRVKEQSWPPQEVISKILKAGFHLVPKPSKSENSDPSTMFRLSFNMAETLLAETLTLFQRECYRVFKMYFYEKLRREPKIITTYHLKTVFYWLLEETDANLWKSENRAHCCLLLLLSLEASLKKIELKHYFIPENNLFKHLKKQDVQEMLHELEQIIADPIAASGQTIEDIKGFYAKKQGDEQEDGIGNKLDQFSRKSALLFKKALNEVTQQKVKDSLQWTDEFMEHISRFFSEKSKENIIRFLFDLIYARNCMAKYHKNYFRYAPLPSPIAMFVQVFLPVLDEITKKVLLPQVSKETDFKKKFLKIENALQIASFLSYEDLLNFAMLRSTTTLGLENTVDIISNAMKHLTGLHIEL